MCRLQFREANINDLTIIKALSEQTFLDAYATDSNGTNIANYFASAFNAKTLSQELLDSSCVFFIVEKDEVAVGYLKMRWDRTTIAPESVGAIELQRFYLLKSYYHNGYGVKMLDFCENYAKEQDFNIMWLLVWKGNMGAIRFYARQSFVIYAIENFDFGGLIESDFLMKKGLV